MVVPCAMSQLCSHRARHSECKVKQKCRIAKKLYIFLHYDIHRKLRTGRLALILYFEFIQLSEVIENHKFHALGPLGRLRNSVEQEFHENLIL